MNVGRFSGVVFFLIGLGDADGLPSLLRRSSFGYEGLEFRCRHGFKAQEVKPCRRDGTAFHMLMTGHVVRDDLTRRNASRASHVPFLLHDEPILQDRKVASIWRRSFAEGRSMTI